jgi:transcriptional regulator with XRE-family HTH domain
LIRGLLFRSDVMARRGPDAVDKLVGRNIRILRLAKGLSQTELADALGVTFQQVQKYEKGTNRVGSGRLLKISAILGVKITDFFEGTDRPHDTARRSVFDQLAQPESFRLVQAFSGIDRPNIRRTLVRLIERIAAEK